MSLWVSHQKKINLRVPLYWNESDKIVPLIFVADQGDYYIGFSMNPSGRDVAFVFVSIQTNP